MRPTKHRTTGPGNPFRARLNQIINMKHSRFSSPPRSIGTGSTSAAVQREQPSRRSSTSLFRAASIGHTTTGGSQRQVGTLHAWLKAVWRLFLTADGTEFRPQVRAG